MSCGIYKIMNLINNKSSHIGQVCRGERKSAQGYKWEFLE